MNSGHGNEPKLLFPGLAGFYTAVSDLWYPMIRITVGAILLTHGWGKIMSGVAPVAATLAKYHLEPSSPLSYFLLFLETIGAICMILGLFTRFFAAAMAIEMAVITFVVFMPLGFGRMEYTLMWGIIYFAISLRGGGPYSLDRVIGKEL